MPGEFNYTSILDSLERDFPLIERQKWMADNWTLSVAIATAYVASVFAGRHLMNSRSGLDLRGLLFWWNLALASFSMLGAARTLPDLLRQLCDHGFHHTVCDPHFLYEKKFCFWVWWFDLSKVSELGDTALIVLRKRPLLFLHWYHHATVLVYSWYATAHHTASARWFVTMNLVAHSLMYTYYAARARGVRVPRPVAMSITLVQLVQMFVGIFVAAWSYVTVAWGGRCHASMDSVQAALLMYASYFLLFLHYFRRAYLEPDWRAVKKD